MTVIQNGRTRSTPKQKKITVSRPTVGGFLPFGDRDRFPQTLKDVISDSDTASGAIQAIQEFIVGDGIKDLDLAKYVVNRHGQTLDDIAEEMAWSAAEGQVLVPWVGYNGNGKKNEIKVIPWDQFRFLEPDPASRKLTHGGVFPFLENPYEKDRVTDHTLCYLFNDDPEVVLGQIREVGDDVRNYRGQLMYVRIGRPGGSYYQIPDYFGTVKNMETEAALNDSDFSTVANGFGVSGFIKQLKKKPRTQLIGNNTKPTEIVEPNATLKSIQDAQGPENTGAIWLVEAETKEELDLIEFVPVTGADLANRYNALNDRVAYRIARRLRVPGAIVNLLRNNGLAPTDKELITASNVMYQTTNRAKRWIERTLLRILDENWFEPIPGTGKIELSYLNYFGRNVSSNSVVEPANP